MMAMTARMSNEDAEEPNDAAVQDVQTSLLPLARLSKFGYTPAMLGVVQASSTDNNHWAASSSSLLSVVGRA